jgi:hypothetical protein
MFAHISHQSFLSNVWEYTWATVPTYISSLQCTVSTLFTVLTPLLYRAQRTLDATHMGGFLTIYTFGRAPLMINQPITRPLPTQDSTIQTDANIRTLSGIWTHNVFLSNRSPQLKTMQPLWQAFIVLVTFHLQSTITKAKVKVSKLIQ